MCFSCLFCIRNCVVCLFTPEADIAKAAKKGKKIEDSEKMVVYLGNNSVTGKLEVLHGGEELYSNANSDESIIDVKDVNGELLQECAEKRREQSDMVFLLLNLAVIPDEVAKKCSY